MRESERRENRESRERGLPRDLDAFTHLFPFLELSWPQARPAGAERLKVEASQPLESALAASSKKEKRMRKRI